MLDRRFESLPHTTDAYLAAYGDKLEDAFANAGLALFDTMTDLSRVEPKTSFTIELEGESEIDLLYIWLEKLLLLFEADNTLFSRIEVAKISQVGTKLRLEAKAWGEPYNPNRHQARVEVKAVTYHKMEISRTAKGYEIRFVLDL